MNLSLLGGLTIDLAFTTGPALPAWKARTSRLGTEELGAVTEAGAPMCEYSFVEGLGASQFPAAWSVNENL